MNLRRSMAFRVTILSAFIVESSTAPESLRWSNLGHHATFLAQKHLMQHWTKKPSKTTNEFFNPKISSRRCTHGSDSKSVRRSRLSRLKLTAGQKSDNWALEAVRREERDCEVTTSARAEFERFPTLRPTAFGGAKSRSFSGNES